jgi:hypothetical protein
MKWKLNLKDQRWHEIELEDDRIRANDVILPEEFNPHDCGLWVVGNEYGALFALWATEGDLLDEAVDLNLMDSFSAEEDHKECEEAHTPECATSCSHSCEHAALGNASEPFDLTYCWYRRVSFDPARDWKLMCRFAEARGAQADTLFW